MEHVCFSLLVRNTIAQFKRQQVADDVQRNGICNIKYIELL